MVVDVYEEAGKVWDSLPVPSRVALCNAEEIDGKLGSKSWKDLPLRAKALLSAELEIPTPTPTVPADTDPTDRGIHAGWSDGKPVYRASMAGRCLKELFLWRIGTGDVVDEERRDEKPDLTNPGLLAAREGRLHEQWVVADLLEQGYEIAWAGDEQRDLERIYKRFIVRSHPDGMIRGLELGEEWHVLECKSMSEDKFAQWMSLGWDGFKGYAYQLSLEMFLSECPAFFVSKNRNTGRVLKLIVNKPPIDPKIIIARYSYIENILEAAEDGEEPAMPECGDDAQWYFCPFFSMGKCDVLKGRDAEEVTEVDDQDFVSLIDQYKAAKKQEKSAKELIAALRDAITERMFAAKLKVGTYFASYSQRTKKGFDIPSAKQWIIDNDGDPAQFDFVRSHMELRITGGPKKEDEEEGLTE